MSLLKLKQRLKLQLCFTVMLASSNISWIVSIFEPCEDCHRGESCGTLARSSVEELKQSATWIHGFPTAQWNSFLFQSNSAPNSTLEDEVSISRDRSRDHKSTCRALNAAPTHTGFQIPGEVVASIHLNVTLRIIPLSASNTHGDVGLDVDQLAAVQRTPIHAT